MRFLNQSQGSLVEIDLFEKFKPVIGEGLLRFGDLVGCAAHLIEQTDNRFRQIFDRDNILEPNPSTGNFRIQAALNGLLVSLN